MNIYDAVGYFSGGEQGPHRSPGFDKVQTRLDDLGYSGEEYCAYIMLQQTENPARLWHDNWMAQDDILDDFVKFKKKRVTQVRKIVGMQQRHIDRLKVFGRELFDILRDENTPINVLVRLNEAEKHKDNNKKDRNELVKRFAFDAVMLYRGCPEYLLYLPLLKGMRRELEDVCDL